MKITEPKTPFVRYNAETDTVEGDIPGFNLNAPYSDSPPESPTQTVSSTGADTSGPSSRRTSISSVGFSVQSSGGGESGMAASGSSSARSAGSGTSSRSTSFNLPDEARKGIRSSSAERGEEVEEDEEMDPEAAEKHAAFLRARGRHYSNEAEAMKRAQELMEEEDTEDDAKGGPDDAEVEDDDEGDGDNDAERNSGAVPPVPAVPPRLNIAAANANAKPQINGIGHSGERA